MSFEFMILTAGCYKIGACSVIEFSIYYLIWHKKKISDIIEKRFWLKNILSMLE